MSQPTPPVPPRVPQASDPAVLANGQVVPRQVQQAPPGGGSFRIDLDRAPQAIKDLEAAADELRQLRDDAIILGRVRPPARDQVSIDAATVLGASAVGGPGSLVQALEHGLRSIEDLVQNMRSELAAYSRTEMISSAGFEREARS